MAKNFLNISTLSILANLIITASLASSQIEQEDRTLKRPLKCNQTIPAKKQKLIRIQEEMVCSFQEGKALRPINWREKLERNPIIEIRHIENQIILDDNVILDKSQRRKNRLGQIWRLDFFDKSLVSIQNVLKGKYLSYDSKEGKLCFRDKGEKGLIWELIYKKGDCFEISKYNQKGILRFEKNGGYKLNVSHSLEKNLWKFSPIYKPDKEDWFVDVIVDWGKIVAARYGVRLENEDSLRASSFKTLFVHHEALLQKNVSRCREEKSGGYINDTSFTISMENKLSNENQISLQTNRAKESGKNLKVTNTNQGKINHHQSGEKTKAHEDVQNKSKTNRSTLHASHEDNQISSRKKDKSLGKTENIQRNREKADIANRQKSKELGYHVSQGNTNEVGEEVSQGKTITTGSSKESTVSQEKRDEVRDSNDESNTLHSEEGTTRNTTLGGGFKINTSANLGIEIPGVGGIGGSVGTEMHVEGSHSWGTTNTKGTSNTKATSKSNTKTNITHTSNTSKSWSENTETENKRNYKNTINTSSQEKRNNVSESSNLEKQERIAQINSKELNSHSLNSKNKEEGYKKIITNTDEDELVNSQADHVRTQSVLGVSSAQEIQRQDTNERNQELKDNSTQGYSSNNQLSHMTSYGMVMTPYSSYTPFTEEQYIYEKILLTQIYEHKGLINFKFSKHIFINLADRDVRDELLNPEEWSIHPSSILKILPVCHVYCKEKFSYYGVQEVTTRATCLSREGISGGESKELNDKMEN